MKTAANTVVLRNIKAILNAPLYEAAKKIVNESVDAKPALEDLIRPHFHQPVAGAIVAWFFEDRGTRNPDEIREIYMGFLKSLPD